MVDARKIILWKYWLFSLLLILFTVIKVWGKYKWDSRCEFKFTGFPFQIDVTKI